MFPEDVSLLQVAIPLVAAAIGAASVAGVARHLSRQELYVEAAQKINDYLDEAADALNKMDPNEDFDVERVSQAKRAVNLAVFHSRRLESPEVTSRLQVADSVLWDMFSYEDRRGRLWAYRAIDDVNERGCRIHDPPPSLASSQRLSQSAPEPISEHGRALPGAGKSRRSRKPQLARRSQVGQST